MKVIHSRSKSTMQEALTSAWVACMVTALAVACEQHELQAGSYVRIHGLKKAHYNGLEGRMLRRDNVRAEVEIAGTWKVIKVHCKNLTLMPTYKVSRCKLMKHRRVQITFEPEPVFAWPDALSGTYYDYLRVDRTASKEHIRNEFKKLSMILHPDKNPNHTAKATQLFKQVMEAYECLRDDRRRAQYDQQVGLAMTHQQTWFTRNTTTARHPKWP